MNRSGFTPRQRLVIRLMVVALVVLLGGVAGFIVTSIQSWQAPAPTPTAASVSPPATPTPLPTVVIPSPTAESVQSEGILSQVQMARLFDQIEREVESLRELTPRAEVPLSFLSAEEMAVLMESIFDERASEARLRPYALLDMLPEGPYEAEAESSSGLYVPEQDQLYVMVRRETLDADDQVLLARAYARALQDQHFDLEAMYSRAATTDATLAARALELGDPTLLMGFYHTPDLEQADWARLADLALEAEQPDYVGLGNNAAWAALRRFPYQAGRQFVLRLYQAGGWEAINRAYADPPRSTEQILHPERYTGETRDLPAAVYVPDLGAALDEPGRTLIRDTLGEFALQLYLRQALTEKQAWLASDGWSGDTFVVWQEEGGGRMRVWRTAWDDVDEAEEVEEALTLLVPHRYFPARRVTPLFGLSGEWWEIDGGALCIYRVGRYVTYAQARDVNALANLVDVLP